MPSKSKPVSISTVRSSLPTIVSTLTPLPSRSEISLIEHDQHDQDIHDNDNEHTHKLDHRRDSTIHLPYQPTGPTAAQPRRAGVNGLTGDQTPITQPILPPRYDSLPTTTTQLRKHTQHSSTDNSIPASLPTQAAKNWEKQAVRDAWARADVDREYVQSQNALARRPPESIQPPSSNSNSDSNSNSNSNPNHHTNSNSNTSPRYQANSSGSDLPHSPEIQITSATPGKLTGPRGHLPSGMDVRDALAQCEDPTLGWSLQFWVAIADPVVSCSIHPTRPILVLMWI